MDENGDEGVDIKQFVVRRILIFIVFVILHQLFMRWIVDPYLVKVPIPMEQEQIMRQFEKTDL